MVSILTIATLMVIVPPISYLVMRHIEKQDAKLNPENFTVRRVRVVFWIWASLGCAPLSMIIYSFVDYIPSASIYLAIFGLALLIPLVLLCFWFLRKRIVVNAKEQMLICYLGFKKKKTIEFSEITKVAEDQHYLSVFLDNSIYCIFSIDHDFIGYELLKSTLKKFNEDNDGKIILEFLSSPEEEQKPDSE
jgi:hypothetical protein